MTTVGWNGGLALRPTDCRAARLTTIAAIVGVTAFIAILDGLLFRQHLSALYIKVFTSPLLARIPGTILQTVVEETLFRLILMTAVVTLQKFLFGKVSPVSFVAAILLSQFVYVATFVIADPVYATLRYWAVGCVWGWLYWRHGWLAALAGHTSTHLVLDPLLFVILLHS